ncbi:MAG: hypothetical protein KBT72_09075 [Zhongshania sp.]|jgi:hypothetical protein|nr:hypothetical protein [Zhongshania sp.]
MAQDSLVQYAYALDEKGALAHISVAKRTALYICPGCKKPLTPVLGEVNAQHFRHADHSCAFESYLHKCAKIAFYHCYIEAISSGTPIKLVLERKITCGDKRLKIFSDQKHRCQKAVPAIYDLTKIFNRAELEKRDRVTGLTPDVMLSDNSSERLCYVEMCVSHPCTPEKIESGIPILEFKIDSVDDIQIILGGSYSMDDWYLRAYNFHPKPKVMSSCSDVVSMDCVEMSLWSLSDSGRLNERVIPLREVDLAENSQINVWPKSVAQSDLRNKLGRFLSYVDPDENFPNCLMCKHSSGWEYGYLECQSKGKRIAYTEARTCASYEKEI